MSKKVAKIDISEASKKKLADAVSNALSNAESGYNAQNLMGFRNGLGVFNLNHIFKELVKTSDENLVVVYFKRGAFQSVFVYDVPSGTLITLTSTANMTRLRKRKEVPSAHYIDALLSINVGYEGDRRQTCMFPNDPDWQTERESLCNTLLLAVREREVQKYIVCEYDIKHKTFSLYSLRCSLYSANYIKLCDISLADYLKPNYEVAAGSEVESVTEQKEPIAKLGIKLKNKKADNA